MSFTNALMEGLEPKKERKRRKSYISDIIFKSLMEHPRNFKEIVEYVIQKRNRKEKEYPEWVMGMLENALKSGKLRNFDVEVRGEMSDEEFIKWVKENHGRDIVLDDIDLIYGLPMIVAEDMEYFSRHSDIAGDKSDNSIVVEDGAYRFKSPKVAEYWNFVKRLKKNPKKLGYKKEFVFYENSRRFYNYLIDLLNRRAAECSKPPAYDLALFFVPVDFDGNIVDEETKCLLSGRLEELYNGGKTREKVVKNITKMEKLLSMKMSEADVNKYGFCLDEDYVPAVACFASGDSLLELRESLAASLRQLRDIAEELDVVPSPLEIARDGDIEDIVNPATSVCHRFDGVAPEIADDKKSESFFRYRDSWFGIMQYSRNSMVPCDMAGMDPEKMKELFKIKDYSSFLRSYKPPPVEHRIEIFDGGIGVKYTFDFEVSMYLVAQCGYFDENKKPTGFGYTNKHITPSIDEVIAHVALDAALDKASNDMLVKEGKYFAYAPEDLALLKAHLEHDQSLIEDDPNVFIVYEDMIRDLGRSILNELYGAVAMKRAYNELAIKLVKDGYAIMAPVSEIWPKFTGEIWPALESLNPPETVKDIIKNDFGTKYGTRTLHGMAENMKYAEVVQAAWENFCSGKRWIS